MEQEKEPAPALSRGLALIRQLSKEGQGVLEQLSKRGGWPKSSTLRYLKTLEREGVVHQDTETKVWHLEERLVPYDSLTRGVLNKYRRKLANLARDSGSCAELYSVTGKKVVLMERADPEVNEIQVLARIGFQRDLRECDSTCLVFLGFVKDCERNEMGIWQWASGEKVPVSAENLSQLLHFTRSEGLAVDFDFNENGIRRFSIPILDSEELVGIISLAQRQTPRAEHNKQDLLNCLQNFSHSEKDTNKCRGAVN